MQVEITHPLTQEATLRAWDCNACNFLAQVGFRGALVSVWAVIRARVGVGVRSGGCYPEVLHQRDNSSFGI